MFRDERRLVLRMECLASGTAWVRARSVTPPRIRTLLLIALGALTLGLFSAAPAFAAPGWLPATNISQPSQFVEEAQVAVDPQGEAVAVWTTTIGGTEIVQAATHPAGGAWSSPVSLTSSAQNANEPQVVMDSQGNAVAVWNQEVSGTSELWVVKASRRPAAGTWSTPTTLSAAGQEAVLPQVAIDPQGNAVAVWDYLIHEGTNDEYVVKIQAVTGSAGTWSAPVELTAEATSEELPSPQVAIDPNGNAVAVWERSEGAGEVVQAAFASAGGNWSAAKTISALAVGEYSWNPQVAVDAQGNAVVLWRNWAGIGSNEIIQAATHPAGGAWSTTATDLSPAGEDAQHPQVAVDPQGNAVAVWELNNETAHTEVVQAKTRPVGGAWSPTATDLSRVEEGLNAEHPQVAVNSQGTAVAVWQRWNGSQWTVQGATRAAAGTWSAATNLSYTTAGEESRYPQVAIDPQGNQVAVWQRQRGTEEVIQAAAYDNGPQLSGLSIPATGTVGRAVRFSVVQFDAWAPARTSWSFGDGRTAHGTAGTHTYTRPGTYTVTVAVENSLHSVVTGTGRITIAPAPVRVHHVVIPARPAAQGTARAARTAKVKGGHALVVLRCGGAGPCRGHFSLTYRHQVKRVVMRHGKRKVVRQAKTVQIGSASFNIAKGKSRTVAVRLSGPAKKLVKAAGKHGIKVQLRGHGVKRSTVVLKGPAPKKKHHKHGGGH